MFSSPGQKNTANAVLLSLGLRATFAISSLGNVQKMKVSLQQMNG